jgi:radical SAM superfamily enzyme YgiQ (UPF0313 family)
LGYDEDTTESFQEILDFAMKHNFTVANFNPLIPIPGTRYIKGLRKKAG